MTKIASFGSDNFWSKFRMTVRRPIYLIQSHFARTLVCAALFCSFAFAQGQTALTLNQINDLLKSGVSSTRVAQLIEQRGVSFELNDAALRQLRAGGADELILSTVKRMAARYADEQQRRKRLEEISRLKSAEDSKREQETTQRLEEVRKRLQEKTRRSEEEKKIAEDPKKAVDSQQGAQEQARAQRPQKGTTATLLAQEDAGRVVSLRNVMSTEKGEVSGEVVNNSKQTLRDVQLQILYSWRWKNEYHPGKDDPGTARYHLLTEQISPGQIARFNYKPSPPLASREDGEFDIIVKVVGFAQIFQQGVQR